MIDENVRTTFLENELRSRRLRVLPQLLAHHEEVHKWRAEMQTAQDLARSTKLAESQIRRQLRRARTAGQHITKADESDEEQHEADVEEKTRRLMLFRWPPAKGPSYLPSREDMADMLQRCRLNARGWLPMPLLGGQGGNNPPAKKGVQAKMKKSKTAPQGSMAEAPAGKQSSRQHTKSAFNDTGAKTRRNSLSAMANVTAETLRKHSKEGFRQVSPAESEHSESEAEEIDKVDFDLEQLGLRPSQMPGGLARPPSRLPD